MPLALFQTSNDHSSAMQVKCGCSVGKSNTSNNHERNCSRSSCGCDALGNQRLATTTTCNAGKAQLRDGVSGEVDRVELYGENAVK